MAWHRCYKLRNLIVAGTPLPVSGEARCRAKTSERGRWHSAWTGSNCCPHNTGCSSNMLRLTPVGHDARPPVPRRSDFPDSETNPFTYDRDVSLPRFPLTPQQSAAVLRDRRLRFLSSYANVSLFGMITSNRPSRRRPHRQLMRCSARALRRT